MIAHNVVCEFCYFCNKFNQVVDTASKKFETFKDEATRMAENGKDKLEKVDGELMGAARSKVNEVRNEVKSVVHS